MDADSGTETFRRVLADLQDALAAQADARPELTFEREPPPRRLAPYATAIAVIVAGDDDGEIAGGRFVLLFDPAGQPGWDGRFRVIGYIRAELEPEMAADPLINAVGWSWLTEALDNREAGYRNVSGTVTTVVTQGFGSKQDEPLSTEFELRASWSPDAEADLPDLARDLAAWCDAVCSAAGLPPLAPGIAPLRPPRRRRRP